MKIEFKNLDYGLSPYSGMTRESWVEAGKYLLEGIFQYVKDFQDPVIVKRTETEITYPHLKAPIEKQKQEYKAERFEGLARSFFIAAPLIKDNPEMEVCGKRLRDYYKNQILRSCTETDSAYIGDFESWCKTVGVSEEIGRFQQTVETGALVIGLWISKEHIWDTYTKEQQDTIARLIYSYAHANTHLHNWRMFNMLDMAFLHMTGYEIDKAIMAEHAQAVLNYYVGDGWYRDGRSFDYYSCWAFNLYAPLWNLWYGYENEPEIAIRFEENSNKLMNSYANIFDEDGFTNMWGRSSIYRNASTSGFVGNFFLKNSTANPGLARRILSGSLLQFFEREDFWCDGVPSLGYYGPFSPMVQGYSCAESPLWLGKPFLVLYFPKDHPIWCAKEYNGVWEDLKAEEVKETILNGPALCFTNHKANGETILRTGKVSKSKDVRGGFWNYAKLSYNTKYPWEATPKGKENVEAQQYVIENIGTGENQRANIIFWAGNRSDVLYRKQYFNYCTEASMQNLHFANLADFPVANGLMRVDKLKLSCYPVSITLGAYGFPDNGTEVIYKVEGNAKAIILKGKDSSGKEKQLAMTIYDGWDELTYVKSTGTNPDSEYSIVVYAKAERNKKYDGFAPYLFISQVITKESSQDFGDDEIFPIKSINYSDRHKTGAYGKTVITMKDKKVHEINFDEIDGHLSL